MSEFVHDWSPLLATMISLIAALAIYWVRTEAKSAISGTASKLHTRLDEHHDRINRLEGMMETLPTREDFHRLAIANTEMAGDMKALKETVKGMHETLITTQRSVQRVNDYLLESKSA